MDETLELPLYWRPQKAKRYVIAVGAGALAGAGAGYAIWVFARTDVGLGNRVVFGIFVLAAAAMLARQAIDEVRVARAGRPRMVVHPDTLLFEHAALFRRPLAIPRDGIRAVAVDAAPDPPKRPRREKTKFPVAPVQDVKAKPKIPSHVYSSTKGSPYPIVSSTHDVPNAVIVLSNPIVISAARWSFAEQPAPLHTPRPGFRVCGLVFRVEDPASLQRAVGRWDVLRDITGFDVAQCLHQPAAVPSWSGWLLAVAMLVFGLLSLWIFRVTENAPVATLVWLTGYAPLYYVWRRIRKKNLESQTLGSRPEQSPARLRPGASFRKRKR